ncbi:MAG: hypothetical protein ACFHWZ_04900 [Phycisphaerales bacterium]
MIVMLRQSGQLGVDQREDRRVGVLADELERLLLAIDRLAADTPFQPESLRDLVGPQVGHVLAGRRDDQQPAGRNERTDRTPAIRGHEVRLAKDNGVQSRQQRGVDGCGVRVDSLDRHADLGLERDSEPVCGLELVNGRAATEAALCDNANTQSVPKRYRAPKRVVRFDGITIDLGDEHGGLSCARVDGGADRTRVDLHAGARALLTGPPAHARRHTETRGDRCGIVGFAGRGDAETNRAGLGHRQRSAGALEHDADLLLLVDGLVGVVAREHHAPERIDADDLNVPRQGLRGLGRDQADARDFREYRRERRTEIRRAGAEVGDDHRNDLVAVPVRARDDAELIECVSQISGTVGRLDRVDEPTHGGDVRRRGNNDRLRRSSERDQSDAVALAERAERFAGRGLVLLERGG